MDKPMIQNYTLQPRIFYLIKLIQDAIYSDNFKALIMRTTGVADATTDFTNLYRFYMRGSSAAILHLVKPKIDPTKIPMTPLPFTSDIDMMVIVNPELPAATFAMIHSLLFNHVMDTIIAFTNSDIGKTSGLDITKSLYDKEETGYNDVPVHSKRLIIKNSIFQSLDDPLVHELFEIGTPAIMVGKNSGFNLTITNEIQPISMPTVLGLSLIEVRPRTGDGETSVLDIAFPKMNFLQFGEAKISRIYYEWLQSNDNITIPIQIPPISKDYSAFKKDPGQAQVQKYTVERGYEPTFILNVPVISNKYAEVDNETAIATTSGEAKKERRTTLAAKLREKIVE